MKARVIFILTLLMGVSTFNVQAQEWNISYNYSYFAPVGFSIGYLPDNVGGYISGKFGIYSGDNETSYYSIDESAGVSNYERIGTSRSSYSGGIMYRLIDKLVLYGGVGYGNYGESWGEDSEDDETTTVFVIKDQFAGPEFEIGLIYWGEICSFGLGCIFMNGTNVERKAQLYDISVQIGVKF